MRCLHPFPVHFFKSDLLIGRQLRRLESRTGLDTLDICFANQEWYQIVEIVSGVYVQTSEHCSKP